MTPTDLGRTRRLTLLQALLLAAAAPCLAQAGAPTTDDPASLPALDLRYAEAQQDYERSHWPQAFAAFTLLATQGHADAARVAWLMHRHGPRLYGQHFVLTAAQQTRLAQQGLEAQRVAARPLD